MTWQPLIDQRNYPDGGEDCPEASVTMTLQHLGHNVSMYDVLAVHTGAYSLEGVLGLYQHFGMHGCYITTGGFNNVDTIATTLFHDNGYANPDVHGRFEHFGDVYAQDAGGVHMANPWGARDIYYPLTEFNDAYIGAVIVPVTVNLANGVRPVPNPVPQRPAWIANKVVMMPNGVDGYLVDGWGGLHPIGAMPPAVGFAYWPHWCIVRDAALNPDGSGGLVLDGYGGIHPFAVSGHGAHAGAAGAPYWAGWDIAVGINVIDWSKPAGYTLDGYGGVHPWGGAPALDTKGAYWQGGIA